MLCRPPGGRPRRNRRARIIERIIEMIEPLMPARRHLLAVRMPTEPISIEADTLWLTQAVQNVIGNAVKYTDPGGQIDIVVHHDDIDVEIRVRDTGNGLAPADLETVFPFVYTGRSASDTTLGWRPRPQNVTARSCRNNSSGANRRHRALLH
jgi:signal transduction histidine kinase